MIRAMKACLFFAALIGGAVAIGACLAAERSTTPAPATDGHTVANPTDHGDGQQTGVKGGSDSSVQTPPDAAGEQPRGDDQDKSASKALKPDAETPPARPTHAHGPHPLSGRGDDNATPSNPIDTRITVNQGRTPENNKKGPVQMLGRPPEQTNRTNVQKHLHVPHSITRPGAVHGPTRNAIGVAPTPNAVAPRVGAAAFPRTEGVQSPLAGPRSTSSPGIRPQGGAPAMGGGVGSGTGARAPRIDHPVVPGSASINGTGMAHGGLRVGEIGGAAKNNGGINGSSVRPKRP
jgi:hypothetical protein